MLSARKPLFSKPVSYSPCYKGWDWQLSHLVTQNKECCFKNRRWRCCHFISIFVFVEHSLHAGLGPEIENQKLNTLRTILCGSLRRQFWHFLNQQFFVIVKRKSQPHKNLFLPRLLVYLLFYFLVQIAYKL